MKDGLMLFAGIALVFGCLIMGMYKFTRTHYDTPEKTQEEVEAEYKQKNERQQAMRDVERRNRDLMRQQKQRIRDMQRR